MPNLIPQEKTQLPLIPRINRYINKLTEDPSNVPKDQWKEVEIPQIGNLGAQIGASLDFIFGSDRIGLDPGENLPYGEPSDFDMAATTMMPGPSLNRFRSITNKVKAGKKLTEAESKLLETFRAKYGAPLELKKGEGLNLEPPRFRDVKIRGAVDERGSILPGEGIKLFESHKKRVHDYRDKINAAEDAKQQRLADSVERGKAQLDSQIAESKAERLKNLHPNLLNNKSEVKFNVLQYFNEMKNDPRYGKLRLGYVTPKSGEEIANRLGLPPANLSDIIENAERDAYNIARQELAKKYKIDFIPTDKLNELNSLHEKKMADMVAQKLMEPEMLSWRSAGHRQIEAEMPVLGTDDKHEKIRESLKKIQALMDEITGKKDD